MDIPGYALVTGAASGIGRAIASKFAQDGAAGVALLDINGLGLEEIRKEIESLPKNKPLRILTHVVDVSDEEAVDNVVNNVANTFGRIDYAVNDAAIIHKHAGGAAFADTKDWKRVLDVNLNGTFFVMRAVAKIMLKQLPIKSSVDGRELQKGSIVNIASISGIVGFSMSTSYCASKHAVIGITRTASEDYAGQGLRINAVVPGYTDTPAARATPEIAKVLEERIKIVVPMQRIGQPSEIADAVMFLSGGRSSFMTGSVLVVDGGYTQR